MMNSTNKIPVNIITGFLGTGKTTAILHLLEQKKEGEQWAVVINEFGKVSIDFETLSPKASKNEKVFEISGGCICCSAKEYFNENLNEIVAQKRFDRIIIEPSGLGGADMVSEIVRQKQELDLMPIICLVANDYMQIEKLQINPVYRNQILKADILVLSKCDLESNGAKRQETFAKLKKDYPNKLDYSASFEGKVDIDLLSVQSHVEKPVNSYGQFFFSGTDLQDSNYESRSFILEKQKNVEINRLVEKLKKDERIIRAKGYLKTQDGWCFFNYTLGNTSMERCDPKINSKLVVISEKGKSDLCEFFLPEEL